MTIIKVAQEQALPSMYVGMQKTDTGEIRTLALKE